MSEQKVVITIDDEGRITAKTSGFKGDTCLDALNDLLDLEGSVSSMKKTDEFHQPVQVQSELTQALKRK